MTGLNFKTTAEIKVPKEIVNQVIGQDGAVDIIQKAAKQRRNVVLIGTPGTGKSMLGQALASLIPKAKLTDVLAIPNPSDEDSPLIQELQAGKGISLSNQAKIKTIAAFKNRQIIFFILAMIALTIPWYLRSEIGDIMAAASLLAGMIFVVALSLSFGLAFRGKEKVIEPKLIVDNSQAKTAPFVDATGAHAGALLGDVKHDPFQCFSTCGVQVFDSNGLTDTKMPKVVEDVLTSSESTELRESYMAAHADKNIVLLGEKSKSVSPVSILSVNKRAHNGKMIHFVTDGGKELTVTPEHKVAINRDGVIVYIEAELLSPKDEVICQSEFVIDERDILTTYPEEEQKRAKDYLKFVKLKRRSPHYGYKRLAKILAIKPGQTRWWNNKMFKPKSIRTIEWLKKQGILPLSINNPKLWLMARVLGSTFGDGGIFANLNGIFLSSSEKKAVKDFGKDLVKIFGKDIAKNSLLREGGEYGHSWHLLNTNRKVIRFFKALGAPIGNKTKLNLTIPSWLALNKTAENEFFGAFFGSELGVPKVHKQGNRLQTLDLGLVSLKELRGNRLEFVRGIKAYLASKGIKTTPTIYEKEDKDKVLIKLELSIKLDNVLKFIDNINMRYCYYKPKKLVCAVSEFKDIKRQKYNELVGCGYGAEHAMKLLQLTPPVLYNILNEVPDEVN